MSGWRPPEHLVIGTDGPCVVISAHVCRVLLRDARLVEYRRRCRGRDPEVDQALIAVSLAALSDHGREHAPNSDIRPDSAMTVDQAATRLGLTSRTVRRMILSGRINGRKIAGRWWIDPTNLDHLNNHHDQ